MGKIENGIKETLPTDNSRFFRRAAGIASILNYLNREAGLNKDWASKGVVELGCGSGSGLWLFRALGASPVGVDNHQWAGLDMWNKSSIIDDIPYIDSTSIDYLKDAQDKSADVICAFDTVADVWTEEVSKEAYRVLKPEGFVVLTWQFVNFSSTTNGSWPEGWPRWIGQKTVLELFDPDSQYKTGKRFTELVDPKAIVKGEIIINPSLVTDDLIFPEHFAMVGKK